MITGIFHIILQVMLVIVLLSAMVMLLLGIGKLFHPYDRHTDKEAKILKHEVDEDDSVITRHSVFHGFLARGERKK